uniref:DH domain-containing protein n=1 Tax=Monopterus albus TaxID=43700 RepID=A0A3Q3J394_MONAL
RQRRAAMLPTPRGSPPAAWEKKAWAGNSDVLLNSLTTSLCSSWVVQKVTECVSHLRTLRVLDQVFFQKMRSVLNSDELACIFPNLPQVYELHGQFVLCETMKKRRETPIVQDIGDVMLARFEGPAGDEFQEQAAQLCSQQSQALELIKNKQRKDPRFAHIIQECEASPHCRRLQLKDLLVSEMQRLTKYPLLLDNIIKHTEGEERNRQYTCCRGILQTVNEVVGETEHRQRLSQYQRRLDAAPQFKVTD